jgi:hypothetical protein
MKEDEAKNKCVIFKIYNYSKVLKKWVKDNE